MDLGSKILLGAAGCYVVYRVSLKTLLKLLPIGKSRRHLEYSAEKVASLHVHLASGAGLFVAGAATCVVIRLPKKISLQWSIPLACVGVLGHFLRRSGRTVAWCAFMLGAGALAAGTGLVHPLVFGVTVGTCSAFAGLERLLYPRTRKGRASLVVAQAAGPALLVVPAQLVAAVSLSSHLPAGWRDSWGIMGLSMLSAALVFGSLTLRTAWAAEHHARSFISASIRERAKSRANLRSVGGDCSDSEAENETETDTDGESRRSDPDGQPVAEETIVHPTRFHDLPFELKRELEVLVCPAHEARIDAALARLERQAIENGRGSGSGSGSGSGYELSRVQKEAAVRVVRELNMQCHRDAERCVADLENKIVGDPSSQALVMYVPVLIVYWVQQWMASGPFFLLPSMLAATTALYQTRQRAQYQSERQSGSVRQHRREQVDRLAALMGHQQPQQQPRGQYIFRPSSQLQPGMRWEHDLDDIYQFASSVRHLGE